MQLNESIRLPRDPSSVTTIRHVVHTTLTTLGVTKDSCGDIELALSEVCNNVIEHAHDSDEYEIRMGVNNHRCTITVADTGRGFDTALATQRPTRLPELTSTNGRGLYLLTALTDKAWFLSSPDAGTMVHFEKTLSGTAPNSGSS